MFRNPTLTNAQTNTWDIVLSSFWQSCAQNDVDLNAKLSLWCILWDLISHTAYLFHCLFPIKLENIMHAAIMTVDQMIYSWFLSIVWKSKLFDQARIIFLILWGQKLVMFFVFPENQKI
jgi:hypothetical protein